MRLKNKTAIVTGATGGIGAATSKRYLEEGANLVMVGRSEEKLISLVINTPTYANEYTDGWKIRRLSHDSGVAVVSSAREAEAFLEAFLLQEKVLEDMESIQNVS